MNSKASELVSAYDFDELSTLAATDPEKFEAVRSNLIHQAIHSRINSERLLELQKQLDENELNGSDACLSYFSLSNWLQDSYTKLKQQIEHGKSRKDSMFE